METGIPFVAGWGDDFEAHPIRRGIAATSRLGRRKAAVSMVMEIGS